MGIAAKHRLAGWLVEAKHRGEALQPSIGAKHWGEALGQSIGAKHWGPKRLRVAGSPRASTRQDMPEAPEASETPAKPRTELSHPLSQLGWRVAESPWASTCHNMPEHLTHLRHHEQKCLRRVSPVSNLSWLLLIR